MTEVTRIGYSSNDVTGREYIIDSGDTLFYIITFSQKGYIIVSADDIANPVLMYSDKGGYPKSLPPAFEEFIKTRSEEIILSKKSNIKSSDEVKRLWDAYSVDNRLFRKKSVESRIDPLVSVTWNQSYPYNKFCPPTDTLGSGGRTWAGCVALAFAQVIKYHNWPQVGKGSLEYTHKVYGKIDANFGATYYDWENMSNSVNAQSSTKNIDAIAQLIFHCGVAVKMGYGPGGSGAVTSDIKDALIKYFRYSDEVEVITKKNKLPNVPYADSEWAQIVKNELMNKRPIVYRGNNSQGYQGHAFVVDGLNDNYFHINWGWGGALNGYFLLTALVPNSSYNFSYDNQMIIKITPYKPLTPSYPANNSKDIGSKLLLKWDSDPKFSVKKYTVQLSFDKEMKKIEKEYTSHTTSYELKDIMAGYKYYWRINATDMKGENENSEIFNFLTKLPESAFLYQNYPNPFNSGTTIRFDIKTPGKVVIKLYSITGEEIGKITDAYYEPKEYRIPISGKNLSSGVYYYKIEAPGFSAVRKMLLLK